MSGPGKEVVVPMAPSPHRSLPRPRRPCSPPRRPTGDFAIGTGPVDGTNPVTQRRVPGCCPDISQVAKLGQEVAAGLGRLRRRGEAAGGGVLGCSYRGGVVNTAPVSRRSAGSASLVSRGNLYRRWGVRRCRDRRPATRSRR